MPDNWCYQACFGKVFSVSPMQSARREIGTQTSVETPLQPGLSKKMQDRRRDAPAIAGRVPRHCGSTGNCPTIACSNFSKQFRLFGNAAFRAVELDKQIGLRLIRQFGVEDQRLHLKRIHKLDTCNGDTHLDGFNHRAASRIHIRERTDTAGNCLRNPAVSMSVR